MSAQPRKRRSPGEGGAYAYQTAAGERWRFKCVVSKLDGTRETINRRGFTTKAAALKAMREAQSASDKMAFVEPSRQKFGDYGQEVIDGMRLKPQTRASYRKNWRLHIAAYPLAEVPLGGLTGQRLTSHYRLLEKSGRKDYRAGEGLSARTVRYIHTIIHGILGQAVKDGLLPRNPADAATPPTAREAKSPEMQPWTGGELAAFLGWAAERSQHYALWYLLAYTGMRRGEALSLRWRDIDLDRASVAVRRSAGIVREFGEGAEMVEDDTKSSKPRTVDLDDDTIGVLRAHRRDRASMGLQMIKPDALVFGSIEGDYRHGEHVSRQFVGDERQCRKALGEDAVPVIRLHDLRHTHATLLQMGRIASDATFPGKRDHGAAGMRIEPTAGAEGASLRESAGQSG